MKTYLGEDRQMISFPIGGIGSGCIGLDGCGRLVDWEIYNRPNKESVNGFSHFGIRAEVPGKAPDMRIMNSDGFGPRMGKAEGFGHGAPNSSLEGAPHFKDAAFDGEFPWACVRFLDESFPGAVSLEGFNPFIPSNEDDSSIPAAFFTAQVRNDTEAPVTYTFEMTLKNPHKAQCVNEDLVTEHFRGICLRDTLADTKDPEYGQLFMGIPAGTEDLQVQHYWYRSGWFDQLTVFWDDITRPAPLRTREYTDRSWYGPDYATLAVTRTLAPGEVWRQRFLMGWFYPNFLHYWGRGSCNGVDEVVHDNAVWKNYYAVLFADAAAVAEYACREWDRLEAETELFRKALYSSALPAPVMEAVGSTISVLKSPTVVRLTDGSFYGFEGCNPHTGSCEGSCTHVWNYAHALPFLFPRLERSMRELDYTYNLRTDGGMPFRLQLPLGSEPSAFRPCVDGQMGGIIKTYREWKLSGDTEWLRRWWPRVKRSLEFAWSPDNKDWWDPEMRGVITGRQHHTLDMELFGPNSWLTSFYLGALKAASEMAKALGDPDGDKFYALYEKGRAYVDKELFNGKYYCQKVDITDKEVLTPFAAGNTLGGSGTLETYWNDEAGQIKYQIAEGCIIDQVLGQWMCEMAGVGEILDPLQVRTALASLYANNFRRTMRGYFNPCRLYAMNDEAGLCICSWPEGAKKPLVPIPYAQECMHGFEYQAACHMIRHGLVEEGLTVVKSVRDRYDGRYRNPWNEIECGSNYARSMASFALLLSFAGFSYDMTKGHLGFAPMAPGSYFWSVDGAWGTYTWNEDSAEFSVLYGELSLQSLGTGVPGRPCVSFDTPKRLSAGESIRVCAQ